MSLENDIKSLKIQGASNIALYSLRYLKKFSQSKGFGESFDKEARKLENARPTAVVLHNCIEIIRKEKKENRKEKIDFLIRKIKEDEKKIGFHGKKLIKSGFQVHTHCHSSEALEIIKTASDSGKFTVIADETRPRMQGLKTARELSKIKNLKVVLIVDSAAGFASSGNMGKKDDIILVGADAIRKEGLVNKIGTYMLALSAMQNKIPFYVASTTLKIDRRKSIEIEMRDPREIHNKIGKKDNFTVKNPAFDITPWNLIAGIVTEKGIMKSRKVLQMIGKKF